MNTFFTVFFAITGVCIIILMLVFTVIMVKVLIETWKDK